MHFCVGPHGLPIFAITHNLRWTETKFALLVGVVVGMHRAEKTHCSFYCRVLVFDVVEVFSLLVGTWTFLFVGSQLHPRVGYIRNAALVVGVTVKTLLCKC